ncbi:MAG: Lrp/AsnC family transcriptional regulator [Sporocytophaga sp.]|jgi:Lrp/AsnC family leucine-responsive transcriptional regulator|nr:Lrp/AsnC family transcriptional regulator [Sporocytophaga sp.]
MTELDDLDIRLLKLLQKDSTLTTKELANKLNLTPTPVHERIKRLERDGYVRKYVALLDNQKLNMGLVVFCNVTLKQHEKGIGKKFVNDIVSLKEVTECYNVSGQYDFMLKVMVKDMPEYQNFIMNKLASIENIGSTHSVFVMGEIKNSTELPI